MNEKLKMRILTQNVKMNVLHIIYKSFSSIDSCNRKFSFVFVEEHNKLYIIKVSFLSESPLDML